MPLDYESLPTYEDDELPTYLQAPFPNGMNNFDIEASSEFNFDFESDLKGHAEFDLYLDSEHKAADDFDLDSKSSFDLTMNTSTVLPADSSKPSRSRSNYATASKGRFLPIPLQLMMLLSFFYLTIQTFGFQSVISGLSFGSSGAVSGKECVGFGLAPVSSYLGCKEWEDEPIADGVLSDLQISIQDRFAEHQAYMRAELAAVAQSLVVATTMLELASEEMAFIRSLMGKNGDGEDVYGIDCAGQVATCIQFQYLARGKGSEEFRGLMDHLQAIDTEMAAYFSFLAEVEQQISHVVAGLGAFVLETTAPTEHIPLNGPLAVLYEGEFNTTESLIRLAGEELKNAIVTAYSVAVPREPEILSLVLQNSLAALPPKAYDDEKVYLCSYAVNVPNTVSPEGVELMSLVCDVEV